MRNITQMSLCPQFTEVFGNTVVFFICEDEKEKRWGGDPKPYVATSRWAVETLRTEAL